MRVSKQHKLDYLERMIREFGIQSDRIIMLHLNPGKKRKLVLNALDDIVFSDECHHYCIKNLNMQKISNLCEEVDRVYVLGEGRPKIEIKRRKKKIEVHY